MHAYLVLVVFAIKTNVKYKLRSTLFRERDVIPTVARVLAIINII